MYPGSAVPPSAADVTAAAPTFCILFGTHRPFDEATLDRLYPNHGRYVSAVVTADARNVCAGYLMEADALENLDDAVHSPVGH